jgi:hypothetical protein
MTPFRKALLAGAGVAALTALAAILLQMPSNEARTLGFFLLIPGSYLVGFHGKLGGWKRWPSKLTLNEIIGPGWARIIYLGIGVAFSGEGVGLVIASLAHWHR